MGQVAVEVHVGVSPSCQWGTTLVLRWALGIAGMGRGCGRCRSIARMGWEAGHGGHWNVTLVKWDRVVTVAIKV
jgi:hypothetical protein